MYTVCPIICLAIYIVWLCTVCLASLSLCRRQAVWLHKLPFWMSRLPPDAQTVCVDVQKCVKSTIGGAGDGKFTDLVNCILPRISISRNPPTSHNTPSVQSLHSRLLIGCPIPIYFLVYKPYFSTFPFSHSRLSSWWWSLAVAPTQGFSLSDRYRPWS